MPSQEIGNGLTVSWGPGWMDEIYADIGFGLRSKAEAKALSALMPTFKEGIWHIYYLVQLGLLERDVEQHISTGGSPGRGDDPHSLYVRIRDAENSNPHCTEEMATRLYNLLEPKPYMPTPKPQRKGVTGHVYVIRAAGLCKIGLSKNVKSRLKELQRVIPGESEVLHIITSADIYKLEDYLHIQFQDRRENGEWFRLSDDDLVRLLSLAEEFNSEH